MKSDPKILKRFLSGGLLLLLFAFFYSGVAFFPNAHTHAGSSLVHSHPYKKDNKGRASHTHTSNEYIVIAGVTHFVSTGIVLSASAVKAECVLNRFIYGKTQSRTLNSTIKNCFFLRPPPFFFSF